MWILFLKSVTLKPNSNLVTIAFTDELRFIRFVTRVALCTRMLHMWPNAFVDSQNYVAASKGWTHRGSISNTVNGRE